MASCRHTLLMTKPIYHRMQDPRGGVALLPEKTARATIVARVFVGSIVREPNSVQCLAPSYDFVCLSFLLFAHILFPCSYRPHTIPATAHVRGNKTIPIRTSLQSLPAPLRDRHSSSRYAICMDHHAFIFSDQRQQQHPATHSS